MPGWSVIGGAVVGWLLWALVAHWLMRPNLRPGDPLASLAYRVVQVYARLYHGLRIEGAENAAGLRPGEEPILVVANHTAGVDPLLVQAALPFEVRWMMAQDMRDPGVDGLWSWARIIFVDRAEGDAGALREALRHLKRRGVLGIFPEGHIERPAGRLLPFQGGLGVLASRAGATVLAVVIDGTPQVDPAWASLLRPSRSRVRFLPPMRFDGRAADPQEVTGRIRRAIQDASGWPDADVVPQWSDGKWWYVDRAGRRFAAEEIESRG